MTAGFGRHSLSPWLRSATFATSRAFLPIGSPFAAMSARVDMAAESLSGSSGVVLSVRSSKSDLTMLYAYFR